MSVFWTSDTHYGHANVIKHANRPFKNLDEMHATMIARWNAVVGPKDHVYHLGDAVWHDSLLDEIFPELNGTKTLIWGNHDSRKVRNSDVWMDSQPVIELKLREEPLIVMSHYAHRVWNKSHHGSLMLYGHSHGTLPGDSQSLDVGVDCWDFTPVTLQQIRARLSFKTPRTPVDHHGQPHIDEA